MLNPILINLSFLTTKPTGITTYATHLVPHLKPLNPTLLTSQTVANYTCYPIPPNLNPDFGTKGHLRRLLLTQFVLPRIYHQSKAKLSGQGSPLLFSPIPEAPLIANCRYIVTVHDLTALRFSKSSLLAAYQRHYIPQVLAQAQHILCNSTATAKDITHFFNISASKITPILLAHDANHFRFLNLPRHNYFLYIGRHDMHKNLHRVISAFAALPSRDYDLWLAGPNDPRYTPNLKAHLEHLGITNRVKFLGYVPYSQLPTAINNAIALVFPSLWEGFGFPVLEAMACGTPVITSNLSSLPEVAGDAAILVDPYNIGEITNAMQLLATDSGLRLSLSSLGIARAKSFSWAKTGLATVEVLSRYL